MAGKHNAVDSCLNIIILIILSGRVKRVILKQFFMIFFVVFNVLNACLISVILRAESMLY